MTIRELTLAKRLKEAREEMTAFETRDAELATREKELIDKVDEVETDEELDLLEETEREINTDREELEKEKKELEEKINELEAELVEIEEKNKKTEEATEPKGERKQMSKMIKRGAFKGMTRTDAEVLIKRDDTQKFVIEVRKAITENRALTGGALLIPEVLFGIVRDEVYAQSKLAPKVYKRTLSGTGRVVVSGAIPEAVWTEACADLNELDIVFNDKEVDGFKVGGYVAVCNALVQDSDFDLANEVLTQIAQAIAKALDKAILYGTGVKMPTGIVTALGAAEAGLIGLKEETDGEKFYAGLIEELAKAKAHGADGGRFFAMNEATATKLQIKALNFNAAGAIVAGVDKQMPIIGGEIVVTDVVPADTIIGGYGQNYLLAERKQIELAKSEHVHFIQDNTVFRGTARYDGLPLFADAFVAITLSSDGVAVPAADDVTFAPDSANA